MTAGRIAGLAALVVAVVAVVLIFFGGSGGTEYTLIFQNSSQLVKDDDVQIGGRRVGSITDIKLTDHNQAAVKIEVEDGYTPLREGTTATVRLTSLSGVANRYIALTPGPQNAPEIPDGATLGTDKTTSAVDLDAIFNMLDPKTLKGLQGVIQGFATQYRGKGKQANEALAYLSPALSTTTRLTSALAADQQSFQDFVLRTSQLVTTLASRRDQIAGIVANGNTTAGAIAAQNQSLSQALAVLPQTLRQGSTTFVNLRATLDDLSKLVAVSKPATKNLASFLATLRPLIIDATPTITQLATLFGQPGPNNDLTNLLASAPGQASALKTSVPNTIAALEKSTPVLTFLRPYAPELIGWFRDFGQTTSNYDANGHYARVQPIFDAYGVQQATNTLQPKPRSQMLTGFSTGAIKRCPGGATQWPADGSAPFTDGGTLDCDPSIKVPGQ